MCREYKTQLVLNCMAFHQEASLGSAGLLAMSEKFGERRDASVRM